MASTGKVIKSLRGLAPSLSRAISSTPSSTQSAAAATAKVTSTPAPAKEKVEFNYKDALNLECRLSEEEVREILSINFSLKVNYDDVPGDGEGRVP